MSTEEPPLIPVKTTVHVPQMIPAPDPPTLENYDPKLAINHPTNFRRLQRNTIILVDYANSLRDVVTYYETQITNLQQLQQDIDHDLNSASDKH